VSEKFVIAACQSPDHLTVEETRAGALKLFRIANPEAPQPELAGAVVLAEAGEIVSVTTDLTIDSGNFATAPPRAWIDTLIDPEVASLSWGGDPQFAFSLLHGLHEKLFAVEVG